MNLKERISVIIRSKNEERWIGHCIQSVIEFLDKPEIIIVDNNSSDETIDIIKKHDFPNIKFLIESDNGIYDAINKGIELSDNEIISILHSDDFYNNENVLQDITNAFLENDSNDIVFGDLIYVKKRDINYNLRYWRPGAYQSKSFLKGWHPPHPGFFCKTEFYREFGGFDEKLLISADFDIMMKIIMKYMFNILSNRLIFGSFDQ